MVHEMRIVHIPLLLVHSAGVPKAAGESAYIVMRM